MFLSTTDSAHIASTGLNYESRMGHIIRTHQMRIHLSREIVTKRRGRGRNGEKEKGGRRRTDMSAKTAAVLNCQPLPGENDSNSIKSS